MQRLHKAVAWIERSKWSKGLFLPLAALLPVSLAGAKDFYQPVETFLDAHPILKVLCVSWAGICLVLSFSYQCLKKPPLLSVSNQALLLRILAQIVGKKVERFGNVLQQVLKKQSLTPTKAFKSLTQPDDQIREIVQGIWSYFDDTRLIEDVEIRVALGRMDQEHLDRFECFYPSNLGPRSDVAHLQKPNSAFSIAKRCSKMVIIPSTLEASKASEPRFVVTSEARADEDGSMICYPITEPVTRTIRGIL